RRGDTMICWIRKRNMLLNYKLTWIIIWALIVPIYSLAQSQLPLVPKEAILNPERGYHIESNYFVHNLKNPFHPYMYPQGWIDDLNERYSSTSDKLTSMQLYLYLTEYVGGDIPEEAFQTMQMLFEEVRNKGYKVVLRFA